MKFTEKEQVLARSLAFFDLNQTNGDILRWFKPFNVSLKKFEKLG